MRWDKSLFQFLTLTVQGADANTTFFIQFGVNRDRSVVGEWLGFSSILRLQVASRVLASQPCLGPSASSPSLSPATSHPFLKGKGGSVEFVRVIAAACWGAGWSILLQALTSVLPPAPCPPQPHVALLSA